MKLSEQGRRDPIVDVMKAIGILCVLIGHSNIMPQGENGSGEWFIALFHVAIFYIISGIVYNKKYSESINSFIRLILRRLRQLWLPYVLINLLLTFLYNNPDKTTILRVVLMIDQAPHCGASWFIPVIFWISIYYTFNEMILENITDNTLYFQIVISLALLLLGYYEARWLPPLVTRVLFGYSMFHVGVCKKQLSIDLVRRPVEIIIAGILSTSLLRICSFYNTISMLGNKIVSPVFYLLVSVTGFVFVSCIAKLIVRLAPETILKAICMIGQSTMFILLLHQSLWACCLNPIVSMVTRQPITANDCFSSSLEWGILYIIIGLTMPALLYNGLYSILEKRLLNSMKNFKLLRKGEQ